MKRFWTFVAALVLVLALTARAQAAPVLAQLVLTPQRFAAPDIALAVLLAESGGQFDTVATNRNGSRDRGGWQFNSEFFANVSDTCARDAYCATEAAYRISKRGTDFSPWTAFRTGRYKKFLAQARALLADISGVKELSNHLIVVTQPGTVLTDLTIGQGVDQQGSWLCIYAVCGNQPGGVHYGAAILVLADDVTIENSRITGGVIGIAAQHVKNLTVRGVALDHQSGWGIYLDDVANAVIEGNDIQNAVRACPESPDGCESAAVMLLNVSNSRIENNTCEFSGNCYYANGERAASNDNLFEDNVCVNSPHNCFEITFSYGNILRHNRALSLNGASCNYPFWVGGSDITLVENEWACVKSIGRAEKDAMDSTAVPTAIHETGIKKEKERKRKKDV